MFDIMPFLRSLQKFISCVCKQVYSETDVIPPQPVEKAFSYIFCVYWC